MLKLTTTLETVAEMTIARNSCKEIGAALGVSVNTAKLYRKRLYRYFGVCGASGLRQSIKGQPTRVNGTQLDVYRHYKAQGLTYKEMARLEGVSYLTIKTWMHRTKPVDTCAKCVVISNH